MLFLLFLFPDLPGVCERVDRGEERWGGSKSRLGWMHHDPVIWLDMEDLRSHPLGMLRRMVYAPNPNSQS